MSELRHGHYLTPATTTRDRTMLRRIMLRTARVWFGWGVLTGAFLATAWWTAWQVVG